MRPLAEYRKVLLALRYGIGDLVMELPAIGELRSRTPAAHLTAVGAYPALELLEGDSRVDELVAFQDFGFRHWADLGDRDTLERFSQWLAAGGFELCIDPSHAVFGAAREVWSRGGDILDSDVAAGRAALRAGGTGPQALRREIEAGWGIAIPEHVDPVVRIREEERAYAGALFRRFGWELADVAGLSPVASSELKRWDAERFAAVADALLQSGRTERVLIFAGPEADIACDVQRAMRNSVKTEVIGAVHLRKVAALLERCSVFVGNDTGLSHLAAAVGTPTTVIFGPTSPAIYRPASPRAVGIGGEEHCPWRRLDAFGPPECVIQNRCFQPHRCVEDIPVEQVLQPIEAVCRPARERALNPPQGPRKNWAGGDGGITRHPRITS